MTLPEPTSLDRGPAASHASLGLLTHRVVRGSRLSLWAVAAARGALAFGLVLAGVLLVARSFWGTDLLAGRDAWIVLVAGWAVVGALAWWRTAGEALTHGEAALWLDLRSDASGRVVTAAEITEASAAPWQSGAESRARAVIDLPRARWSRLLMGLALGATAVFATRFVPQRSLASMGQDPLTAVLEERLAEVTEKLEVLDEEVELAEEDRAELEASLERLEEAIQDDPDIEATYEALDRMEEQLAARAEEALAEASAALQSLAEKQLEPSTDPSTEASADGTRDPANPQPEPDLESSPMELSELGLSKLAQMAAGDLSGLSKEELEKLSSALESAMSEPLSALKDAGLISKAQESALSSSLRGTPSSFKPAGELPELSAEQLAMLGLCPDCGEEPCEKCKSTGEP